MADSNISAAVLAVYLLALLALGWAGYRRSSSDEEDYFLAGRQQNWWVTALSIMATYFSAFAMLGAPGMVYREGVAFALISLNPPVGGAAIYLLGSRIWRLGRAARHVTPADLVCSYYGDTRVLRLLMVLTAFLWVIPYIMMQIQAGGVVWGKLFPGEHSFETGAVLLAGVTMFYVLVGGMRSVAWSDVLQGVLLMGGMLLGGLTVLVLSGGVAALGESLLSLPTASLTLPGTTGSWPWPKILTVCLFAPLAGILQPAQWMRLYAARGPVALRRSALCFSLGLPPCFLFGTMLVGLGGQVLYPLVFDPAGGVQPAAAVGGYDDIFVLILRDQLPLLLGGAGVFLGSLVLVAIMAASMSTADSSLHALSAVVVRDLYGRFARPEASGRERLAVGRLVILITTVVALGLVIHAKSLERAGESSEVLKMLVAMGLVAVAFTTQLLPMAVDLLFVRRGTRGGAIAGLCVGLFAALLFGPLWSLLFGSVPWVVQDLKRLAPMDASAWALFWNVPGLRRSELLFASRRGEPQSRDRKPPVPQPIWL